MATAAGRLPTLTDPHARAVLALQRTELLLQYLAFLRELLHATMREWVTLPEAEVQDLPPRLLARRWAEKRGLSWLERETQLDVAEVNAFWHALQGARQEDSVLRMELLSCISRAAALQQEGTRGGVRPKAPQEERRAALSDAAGLFRLIAPDNGARLRLEDWDRALTAWSRSRGAAKTDVGKWESLAKFAKKAGFPSTSADALKKQWAVWEKRELSVTART